MAESAGLEIRKRYSYYLNIAGSNPARASYPTRAHGTTDFGTYHRYLGD